MDVNGPGAHPVWRFLKAHQPGDHGYPPDIDWNWNKYLVNRGGYPIVRYPLAVLGARPVGEDLAGLEGWISCVLPPPAARSHPSMVSCCFHARRADACLLLASAVKAPYSLCRAPLSRLCS